jgi:hypothetical protein
LLPAAATLTKLQALAALLLSVRMMLGVMVAVVGLLQLTREMGMSTLDCAITPWVLLLKPARLGNFTVPAALRLQVGKLVTSWMLEDRLLSAFRMAAMLKTSMVVARKMVDRSKVALAGRLGLTTWN